MKEIPNDCLIVKPKKDVSPFTHLTWNSNGCPKTIPYDIYQLNEYRLDVVEDPHSLIPIETKPEPKEAPVDLGEEAKDMLTLSKRGEHPKVIEEAKDRMDKVKGHGKGKNRKR